MGVIDTRSWTDVSGCQCGAKTKMAGVIQTKCESCGAQHELCVPDADMFEDGPATSMSAPRPANVWNSWAPSIVRLSPVVQRAPFESNRLSEWATAANGSPGSLLSRSNCRQRVPGRRARALV